MKKIYSLLLFALLGLSAFAQQIKSPAEFLGYKLGDQFTYQYKIAEYFNYIAQASKNMKLVEYGTTNEGRPLLLAFIASVENIGRLDEIRQNNMKLSGMASGTGSTKGPAVVWLSYNVHGNEPASSEAAMQTLYDLVNPANAQTQQWLKNTVVIIDPCLNPDGRDRYVNFYNSVHGITPDAYNMAREHNEPWPGGRVNHYYFDLNRDWAWQTQREVAARLVYFNQWLPQVHVDFHEQGYNSPYYFAPAAEPFHKDITPWQREFQVTVGKNNAKYFDQNGWMYFTKQEFDLLYPSYGDTYPIYNGSIGMTFEQGGISAGLAVVTRSGDTLTLADRIAHHHTTSLSTVEVSSQNATKLLTEYKKFFDNSRSNPPGEFKAYVVKNDNDDKIEKLAQLLNKNGIQYGFGINRSVNGFNYFDAKNEQFKIEANDLVINAAQPKAVLLNVLMEPKTFIADSNTYDITAWSLPYAYGLKAYGLHSGIDGLNTANHVSSVSLEAPMPAHPYAYVAQWQSNDDVKFLAALLKAGIKIRYAETPFEAGGRKFNAGSLIITRAGNNTSAFDQTIKSLANETGRIITPITTGFVDKGYDLGSSYVHNMRKPKVMLIAGDGINSEAMGEIWHYFDQQIGYPVTLIRPQDLSRVKLSDFDEIILPDGRYNDLQSDKLQAWVRDGGKLIAMGDAVSTLASKGFGIKRKEDKEDKDDKKAKQNKINIYGDRDRDDLRSSVPGAIYKVTLDNTHPLAFGYPKYYYTLKLSDDVYDYLGDDGWNVGALKKGSYVSGFVGQKAKAKINDGIVFGVQSMGRGTIVYLTDDPLFRSFWENGKLLFGNAVFMVGN